MPAWDNFLTADDLQVLARRKQREPLGPGTKVGLLVVDMQNTAIGYDKPIWEQLDEFHGACGPHAYKAIPVQQALLSAARAAGAPVIFSKHVFHAYTGLPASAPGNNFSADNVKSEISPLVPMVPGDLLLEKQTPSCFNATNLALMLKHLGVDGLLVVGNSTSGCVRATCVDGAALGYRMSVVEEGVFDRIELSHAAALFDMQFKICDVISAERAMQILGADTAAAKAA